MGDLLADKRWRTAFVVAALGLLYLALRPQHSPHDWFWQADKVRHVGAFMVLWGLGWRARLSVPPWRLVLGLLAFGGSIEILQSLTPDREASALDLCADAVGIGLGLWLTRRLSPPAT